MVDVYVDNAAAGGGNGTTWALAYQTLSAALTGTPTAGADFWVAHTHAESTAAAVTLTSPGTSALPCRVICVNKAVSAPFAAADLATTATISTALANSHIHFAGIAYCYGIEFKAGDGTNILCNIRWNSGYWKHKNCKFTLNNIGTTSAIIPANAPTVKTEWEDCTVKFAVVQQTMVPLGFFNWNATSGGSAIDATGAKPTFLFGANGAGTVRLRGLDLSQIDTGKTIVQINPLPYNFAVENCRLGTGGTKAGVPTIISAQDIIFSRVEPTGLNYTFDKIGYTGTESVETTIVRTGGASDGTTPVSKKVVTSTFSRRELPFECIPITVWNETTSSITLTVQGIWGGGAVPTNANIWIEAEYLSNAGYPITSVASSAPATVLTTPSNYSAGTGTWGGSTTKFAMAVTFTPAMKGPITVRIKCALLSSTFYIDPKVIIT